MRASRLILLAAASAVALSACQSVRNTVGLERVRPDEFLTVSTAPLTVPLRATAKAMRRSSQLSIVMCISAQILRVYRHFPRSSLALNQHQRTIPEPERTFR